MTSQHVIVMYYITWFDLHIVNNNESDSKFLIYLLVSALPLS